MVSAGSDRWRPLQPADSDNRRSAVSHLAKAGATKSEAEQPDGLTQPCTVRIPRMITEPPYFDIDFDAATRLCLADGKIIALIQSSALASLLWSFWFFAAKGSHGAEISFSNFGDLPDIPDCIPLDYCEITLTGEGPVMEVLHNPVAEFLHRERRVDLSVNRLQAEHGYRSLQRFGTLETGNLVEQVELFGRLVVRLADASPEL